MHVPLSFTAIRRMRLLSLFARPLLVLFLFIPRSSTAQIYDFKTYSVREGMISNSISYLCQDSYGYLWIGTGDGISVYDGAIFRNYSVADGLASSLVNCVCEDVRLKGVVWIGTNSGGVSRFEDGEFRTFVLGSSDWSNRVNSIAQDSSGTVYCATDGGMYVIRDGVAAQLSGLTERGAFNQVVCRGDSIFMVDSNGTLRIYDIARGVVHVRRVKGSPDFRVSRLGVNYDGDLVAVSDKGSVADLTKGTTVKHVVGWPAKFVIGDRYGYLWIGTQGGLYKVSEKRGRFYPAALITDANGLQQNDLTAGTVDREGDLWIGTAGRGLAKLRDKYSYQFPVGYDKMSANNSLARSDRAGHIWVAAREGVAEIWSASRDVLRRRFHPYKDLKIQGPCTSLQVDPSDNLWLASERGIIYRCKISGSGESGESLNAVGSISLNKLMPGKGLLCIYVDREGRIWYSRDLAGVVEIDARAGRMKARLYTTRDGLPDNSIRAIYEDRNGNMWFGGYIGGLAELPKGSAGRKMILYTRRDGLPDNSVRAILEDNSGNLWIGTRYGGAAIMEGKRSVNVSVKDGLVSDGVWAMSCPKGYGMFFATQLGIQELGSEDETRRRWRVYGDATPFFACGTVESSSGDMILWGCNAYGVFLTNLSRDAPLRVPPLVHLKSISINGRETLIDQAGAPNTHSMELRYSQNTITFNFSGISLRDEGNLTYRYMLHGLDRNWRVLRHRVPVTYAALKPGKYSFEVRAVNAEGLESSDAATLSFVIVPPYWQTWWFALSAGIVLMSLIYLSIRMKVRRIIELERVRSKIATDLHDDIGSGLTRIAILADVALRQSEKAGLEAGLERDAGNDEGFSTHGLVEKIGLNARELVDSMRDVVWSLDPKNTTLGDLISRFRSFANEMCEAGGIALRFEAGDELKDIRLDPAVMRTLLLICKEALNNSVKHSGCRAIHLRITYSGKRIKLLLSDDGRGFSTGDRTGGHGLDNMRARAARARGKFALRSSLSGGTVIEVELPVGR